MLLLVRCLFAIAFCSVLVACHAPSDVAGPPAAYIHFDDKLDAQMLDWGIPWRIPCTKSSRELGSEVTESIPDDRCFRFSPPKRMTGLWRNDFEGQAFCAAPAKECPTGKWRPNEPGVAWIDFAKPLPGSDDTPPGGLYAIDFIGRKTAYAGHYGEYGFYNDEVIVDRLISIKIVEPPRPGRMSGDLIAAYQKDCAGKPICMPNSEISGRK